VGVRAYYDVTVVEGFIQVFKASDTRKAGSDLLTLAEREGFVVFRIVAYVVVLGSKQKGEFDVQTTGFDD
jgi:hypothetical protein